MKISSLLILIILFLAGGLAYTPMFGPQGLLAPLIFNYIEKPMPMPAKPIPEKIEQQQPQLDPLAKTKIKNKAPKLDPRIAANQSKIPVFRPFIDQKSKDIKLPPENLKKTNPVQTVKKNYLSSSKLKRQMKRVHQKMPLFQQTKVLSVQLSTRVEFEGVEYESGDMTVKKDTLFGVRRLTVKGLFTKGKLKKLVWANSLQELK